MTEECKNCVLYSEDEEYTDDDWWWVPECDHNLFPHGGPVLVDASTCKDFKRK